MIESINRIDKISRSKSLLLLLLMVITSSVELFGQTNIYTQNFGTGTSFPVGWTSSGTQPWSNSVNSSSSGYPGASGGSNALHTNVAATGTLTFSNNLSTIGYSELTVLWAANRTGNNVTTFEYSPDGTNWFAVSFTDATNNATWMLVNGGTRISLPANAEGVSNLRFRWTHTGDNSPVNFIRFDDFTVQGCQTPAAFTVTGGGNYCSGSTVPLVGLSNSETGVNYQLKIGGVNTGSAIPGTGSAISFGNQATTGSYTVAATRVSGGCTNTMTGSVTVSLFQTPLASATSTNVNCFGGNDGTITINATGGTGPYYFSTDNGTSWTPSSGSGLGSPQTIGNLIADHGYRIKVKDSNGCISK